MRHVADYDLIHIHALFSFASISAGRAARANDVPYIVRPLGLLNAYGMQQRRRLVKQWSFRMIEKPLLDHAATIHYTSIQERDEAAHLRIKAPAQVIPLGIDLTSFQQLPPPEIFYQRFPETRGKQIILFLSRLDPKKGLDLLLPAFAKLIDAKDGPHLVIAGAGSETYVGELKNMAQQLAIAHRITWAGQVGGTLKQSALAAANLFVLPSYSENFGIALLEAMASGLPCVSTSGVALAHEAGDALLMVDCDSQALCNAMRRLLDDTALAACLRTRAATLAEKRYSLAALGFNLAEMYRGIIHTP